MLRRLVLLISMVADEIAEETGKDRKEVWKKDVYKEEQ